MIVCHFFCIFVSIASSRLLILSDQMYTATRSLLLFRNFKIVLAIFLIWLQAPFAHGQDEVYFSKIGIEEGLSQLSVMTIYQDELGRMWFGTREGLNIYDGNRITILQPTGCQEI